MRIPLATVPFLLAAALATACGSPKKDAGPAPATGAVAITLARATANDIDVTIHVTNSAGNPVLAASPSVTIAGGTKSAVVEAGGGDYTTTVTPDILDSEVKITAASADASATKVALAFANLDASLGQPEAIDGLVNTPAWEDGVNVSPDGKWLIISTYVPLDALACAFSGNNPANAACKSIIGPVAAPARPGMLGASRIHGTTWDNVCPSFGITTPSTTIAFIPVAAYGFERQPDGSFANPFVIGWEADGCLGPYGMSFTATPSGTSAGAIFSDHDPFKGGSGTDSDLYYTPLTLGAPNILGTYTFNGAQAVRTNDITTVLPPVTSIRQGNPSYSGGRIWWDNEDLAQTDRDLYYSDVTGTLPAITATSAGTVGVSLAGQEEIQPSLDGNTLYWMGSGQLFRSTLTASADPKLAGSWSARQPLLGPASATNILAAGEPTVAHVGGKTELYFVYIKKTPTGYDGNAARVPMN